MPAPMLGSMIRGARLLSRMPLRSSRNESWVSSNRIKKPCVCHNHNNQQNVVCNQNSDRAASSPSRSDGRGWMDQIVHANDLRHNPRCISYRSYDDHWHGSCNANIRFTISLSPCWHRGREFWGVRDIVVVDGVTIASCRARDLLERAVGADPVAGDPAGRADGVQVAPVA